MTWQQLFFSYQGRINRAKYWLAALAYVIIGLVVYGVLFALVLDRGSTIPLAILLGIIGYVLLVVSGFSVGVKRLHDRNKSGWWILVFYILPGVLSGIAQGMAGPDGTPQGFGLVLSIASLAISIWAFIELGCLRGTIGPNDYGPDPLEGRA